MRTLARNTSRVAVVSILLSGLAAAPAGAQGSRTSDMPDSLASWYHDPQTARILGSFIPGGGHMYAGEKLRGAGFAGAALVGIVGGIITYASECRFLAFDVGNCGSKVPSENRVSGITQLATGIAAWVFGAIDAPRAAQRANEQARRRVSISPVVRDDLVRHAALGVAVTVGW